MSMFEDGRYRWRETYFVLFRSGDRPMLKEVEKALRRLNDRYVLTNHNADDDGRFDSLTLLSPDDFAALDICYIDGEEVLEQGAELAEQMEPAACEAGGTSPVSRVRQCDGRFDVLHFEEVPDPEDEDEDEMLDPSALLLVLDALAGITSGLAIDPKSGALVSEDD